MKFNMTVCDRDGEKFFCLPNSKGDLLFDSLRMYGDFRGGSITIIRGGDIIGRTKGIFVGREYEGYCTGLSNLFRTYASGYIRAQNLDSGDNLILDIPHVPDNADPDCLADYLIRSYEIFVETVPIQSPLEKSARPIRFIPFGGA